MKKNLFLIILIILTGCSNRDNKKTENIPLKSVEKIDLNKYMGIWYEIGRYPNKFQSESCDLVTAEYTLKNDGTVKVVNSCWQDSVGGKRLARAEGKAVVIKNEISKLKVTFFWPFSGNYWIIEIDENYTYAVVSEPKREYLWILSRNPIMEKNKINEINKKLNSNGFDSSKIIWNRYMKNK